MTEEPVTSSGKEWISYRTLWLVAIIVESVLLFLGSHAGHNDAVFLAITQTPSLLILFSILTSHPNEILFNSLLWLLQSAFFAGLFSLAKWIVIKIYVDSNRPRQK